jgi:hypothetical protein
MKEKVSQEFPDGLINVPVFGAEVHQFHLKKLSYMKEG